MSRSALLLRVLEFATSLTTVIFTFSLIADIPVPVPSVLYDLAKTEEGLTGLSSSSSSSPSSWLQFVPAATAATWSYPTIRSITNGMGTVLFSLTNVVTEDDVNLAEALLRESTDGETRTTSLPPVPPYGIILCFVWALGSCGMTLWLVLTHLLHYTSPIRQRYVIRILLMVPIYAIDSYWCYIFYHEATWISIARDTYEAYVLYNFFALLMDYVGGEEGCVEAWVHEHRAKTEGKPSSSSAVAGDNGGKKQKKTDVSSSVGPTMPHSFPMNHLLPPMKLNLSTLWWWKASLVQYMVLSPLLTVASYVFAAEGFFDESSYSPADAHLYVMLLKTVSVTIAFTALFYLYLSTHDILHHVSPTAKFISIKFVIFFSFWQYLVISTLAFYDLIPHSTLAAVLKWSHLPSSEEDHVNAMCNMLLLAEMFITSLMHMKAFSLEHAVISSLAGGHTRVDHGGHQSAKKQESKSATSATTAPKPFWAAVRHAFSIRDILHVTRSTANVGIEKAQRKLKQN